MISFKLRTPDIARMGVVWRNSRLGRDSALRLKISRRADAPFTG